ncbi:unnamed protein product, partial [marine sediment metagenome]
TPTVQNLTNLEADAKILMKNQKHPYVGELKKKLEMLIRAYDPCITCSVH